MKRYNSASEIRAAFIGYGMMGAHHYQTMTAAGMTPVVVADISQGALDKAKKECPDLATCTDVDDMLARDDIDLITISLPHNLHEEYTVKCLNAGKHVVIEKPMAITTDECDRMIACAKTNDRMLSVYHNRHWDQWAVAAADAVNKGLIGEVVRIEGHLGGYGCPGTGWRGSKSISGGVLYDMGVHLLEQFLQMIDSEITEVSGFSHKGFWAKECAWGEDTIEDDGIAIVRFRSGQSIILNITCVEAFGKAQSRGWGVITGTKGSFVMNPDGCRIVTREGESDVPMQNGGWHHFYRNIADHLVNGADLIITPELGRKVVHILDLACKSAEQGMAVKLE